VTDGRTHDDSIYRSCIASCGQNKDGSLSKFKLSMLHFAGWE